MRSIFSQPGNAALEFSPQERVERLGAVSPRQQTQALLFLSGYAPAVFDAVLDAVEPCDENDNPDAGQDAEPFCAACAERVGIFLRHGLDWRHYRGEEPGGPFEIFDPGHEPAVTWRPAVGIAAGIAAAS
jgi:hypothetical protein